MTQIGNWKRPARRAFCVVFGSFGLMGGWSAYAELDSAVTASGTIAVQSDRKAVQHFEGGIVKDLMVQNDSAVKEGQILIKLEITQAQAQHEMARAAVYTILAEQARLQAESENTNAVVFPLRLKDSKDHLALQAMESQLRVFRERKSARSNEISILNQKIAQSERQIDGLQSQIKSAKLQLASVTNEFDRLKPLALQGLVPVTRTNPLERQKMELEGKIGTAESDTARLRKAIDESRLQIEQVGRKTFEDVSGKLAENSSKLGDAEEKLRVANDVLTRTEIKAPRSGKIVGLKIHTLGAVIKAGDTLMEIVPADDILVVSAKMSPQDINHVREGLPAEVRLPSFKQRTTPMAIGSVLSVGADAIHDENNKQAQPFYELRISVEGSKFPESVRGKLKPGMPAEVFVATGARTVLAYLTQPILDALRHGMRET